MPIGTFLESFPSALFIAAHVMFLVVGIAAWRTAASLKRGFSPALLLYVISQVAFLAFFGGVITMKMAVLTEQTLMVLMVLAVGMRRNT